MNEQILELASLIKLHLFEEYGREGWLTVDQANYTYFKQFAAAYLSEKKAPSPRPAPAPQKAAPPPKPRPIPKEATPVPEKTDPAPQKPTKIEREPLSETKKIDFHDIRLIIEKHYPHIEIIETIPEFFPQKKKKAAEVVILSETNHPLENQFLENVAKAISAAFRPASVHKTPFEPEKETKYILSTNKTWKGDAAAHIFMETPSVYLNDYMKKKELWNTICECLQ